jgi:penicillin-binding protein 1C
MKPKLKFNRKTILLFSFCLLAGGCLFFGFKAQEELSKVYERQNSILISDRNNKPLCLKPNPDGYYSRQSGNTPSRFKELLIQKEDRYFFWHPGFNPISIVRAFAGRIGLGERKASSTISQQLAKILLKEESERNLKNKTKELWYAVALETFQTKDEILNKYINSVYFGNSAQGLFEASRLYFGVDPELLTDRQIIQLLATISAPTKNNPATEENKNASIVLAKKLGLDPKDLIFTEKNETAKNMRENSHSDTSCFEISSFSEVPSSDTKLTIDSEVSEKVRKIAATSLIDLNSQNANNAAVLIIKLPENEIITAIGSPDPGSSYDGYKINMLESPRAIGSTIKPFIYLTAFEQDLRPYTLAEDREYKYITAIGYPLYPKNFDWKYHGEVTLHFALANSLNVPTVKTMEYVGLENFYKFLGDDLEFKPIQPFESYQLGIALGSLEMTPLDLARYFTIFPNEGILKGLKIYEKESVAPEKKIADPKYIQLINKILNDRHTGIEQFGMKSDLNLFQNNYALKTGTSRDFRDSWVVGYTPDFLVAVWVGNADNTPMEEISGQAGAGRIWTKTMELIMNSGYNKKTPLDFTLIKEFPNANTIEYGLAGDNYEKQKNLLKEKDSSFILTPHDGDTFLLEKNTAIFLKAKENVKWYIDGALLNTEQENIFYPKKTGQYEIKATKASGQTETVTILVKE